MGKITVKHYLNTNLKPYIINGERYFSIYALVTANRQNTKVKSNAFNEYYSEKDFEEINNPGNSSDYEVIKNEEITISNIAGLIIGELEIFDTTLFAAIYNYYQNIYIFDIDIETSGNYPYEHPQTVNLFYPDKNKAKICLLDFFQAPFSLRDNQSAGMSIYTWYSAKGQLELRMFLEKVSCAYDIEKTVDILNKIVFYKSFQKLNPIIDGSRKYESLISKYSFYFEMPEEVLDKYYQELSLFE